MFPINAFQKYKAKLKFKLDEEFLHNQFLNSHIINGNLAFLNLIKFKVNIYLLKFE